MKCTNNQTFQRRRRNRKKELRIKLISSFVALCLVIGIACILVQSKNRVVRYETSAYQSSLYQAELFATELCVAKDEVAFDAFRTNDEFKGALLLNLDTLEVLFAQHPNARLYPASTTKIMTAYLALKYGTLDDTVTISKRAVDVPSDSSTAHLLEGDVLTLKDLLYALMLPSGNDSAVAIAEQISGSVEAFVELMNTEANALGATNTHFV